MLTETGRWRKRLVCDKLEADFGRICTGFHMDIVKALWPIVAGFIGFLVWLIRLEARSVENGKEIKRLWHQRREDLEMSKQARDETNRMLGEIRDDIKDLIGRIGK